MGKYIGLRGSKALKDSKFKGGSSADGSNLTENKVRLMNVISAKWWHQWCDYTNFDLDSVV